MKSYTRLLICAALPIFSACSDNFGDYPKLMPTDQLLTEPELSPAASNPVATTDNVKAEAEALRARADALRNPVIDTDTKRRMHQ